MTRFLPATWRRPAGAAVALVLALGVAACADVPSVTDSLAPSELALVAQTTREALEANKVGVSSNWSNAATGHLGTVTPTRTLDDADAPCRSFQQTVTVAGRTIIAYDTACRDASGDWSSVSYGSLTRALTYGPRHAPVRYYTRRSYYDPYYDPWYPYHDPFCAAPFCSSLGFGLGFGGRF